MDYPLPSPDELRSRDHVLARLGRAGAEEVFLAVRVSGTGARTPVLLQQLRAELAAGPDGAAHVAHAQATARIALRLQHPQVARTLEIGERGTLPYRIVEHVPGAPLRAALARGRRDGATLPVGCAVAIALDVLSALTYLHGLEDHDGRALGVAHGAVTPAAIAWTDRGEILLVGGAPAGRDAARADIAGAGRVLWELLAGAESGALAPGVSPALVAVCERATAADPAQRYATAAAMRDALLRAAPAYATRAELAAALAARFAAEQAEAATTLAALLAAGGALPVAEPTPALVLAAGATAALDPPPAPPRKRRWSLRGLFAD